MGKMTIKNYTIDEGRPLICVPVISREREAILRDAETLVRSGVQMIEWRVDWYQDAGKQEAVREVLEELRQLMKETILLFTFRTKKQGGERDAEEAYLKRLYELAAESGAVDVVDMEFFGISRPQRQIKELQSRGVKVLTSHHDFEETPADEMMTMVLEQMAESGADIVKLAVMPRSRRDVLRLMGITSDFKEKYKELPVVTMSMGAYGTISRISGEIFGSCITFGSYEQPSAPGQLQMEQLKLILDYLHETGNR